ncbi:MAG TPA: hypothetical protein VFK89_10100 [Actinomycetota bacterium]|nr:hypothetical protein [Actinomycetota bacterium]
MSASRSATRLRRLGGVATTCLLAAAAIVFAAPAGQAVTGTVSGTIEIDQPSANLYPGGSTASCPVGTGFDWVKDCNANTDAQTLVNSVATGIEPGVTGKSGGTGHWNGVRIVDGIGGNDQDIFLTGGKENDTSTWNVGPGTVGSSKYDATQAYLANNSTNLFFGMERRGNNGTTAFDFEFNQAAPSSTYVPTRTVGDVLLTFEMSGSGSSGSATPHYFRWNGSAYVEGTVPSGTTTSINNNDTTPAAPWGQVDSKGNWTGGNLLRFGFAEAKVPLSALPGVNACGGHAYTQVRTRSSSTDTSDLKDTTKIFRLDFATPTVTASKASASGSNSTVTVSGSVSGIASPQYQWQRFNGTSWVNITGATSASYTYSSFETDATASSISFSLSSGDGAGSYVAKLYQVQLRLRASDGTSDCTAYSSGVTVKKIVAVDP